MNNKGQALVEFILVLPIILIILFAIVDMGMIFTNKASLENDSYEIAELIRNDTSIDEVRKLYDDININVSIRDNYEVISMEKKVKLITPGMSRILSNPFVINIERVIPYEA